MNIEEKKKWLEGQINIKKSALSSLEKEYNAIKNGRQPKISELYDGIEKFFSIETRNGTYRHILGGDGRSRPYDEVRNGKIVTVTINDGIYLDREQRQIVKDYVYKVHKPDNLEFNSYE